MGDTEPFPSDPNTDVVSMKDKKLLSCRQTVSFGSEAAESHELCCSEVRVVCGPGTHTSGSSNVKLRNIVDFNWELKAYSGQLIAVHIKGNFFAYGLKAMGKTSESPGLISGMVRVVSRTSGQRSLIRGLKGMVQDLAFSHLHDDVVLACVDQQGVLLVHHIQEKENPPDANKLITCTLLLHIERDNTPLIGPDVHRVVWCPYIPEEGVIPTIDSEVGQLLVLTRGSRAEMWCVPLVNQHHGNGPLLAHEVERGVIRVPPLDSVITDAAFSPDGTALAIATLGGLVSFFQVYMHNTASPRCLHSWRPHSPDKPLNTLYFLDNHREYNSDIQFWKWAVTGARDNSEIKLWACESWTCLQTITFEPNPSLTPGLSTSIPRCILKAALDLSSHYVVLSDLYNKMLYVLHLQLEKGPAHVSVVSGFTLPQPAISFGIFDASLRTSNAIHDRPDGEEEDGEVEFEPLGLGEGEPVSSVVLRMFVVQPKSLQECQVAFKLDPKPPTLSNETLVFQEDTSAPTNGEVNDLSSMNTTIAAADLPANHSSASNQKTPVAENINLSGNALNASGSLNLMTPEAFSSPARHEDSPSRASNVSSSGGSAKRISHTPPAPQTVPAPSELQQIVPTEIEPSTVNLLRDGALASGGSSPSREVQQILALKDDNGDLVDEDYYEEKVEPLIDVQETIEEVAKEALQGTSTYNWPQIPLILPMEESQPKKELINAPPPCPPVIVQSEEILLELRSLQSCIQALTVVVNQQQSEIKELRNEVACQAPQKDAQEAALCGAVERVLTRQFQRQSQAMDIQISEKLAGLRDSLASAFTKSVDGIVSARLNQSFKTEVQAQLIPVVLNSLKPLHEVIRSDVANNLSVSDKIMRENLTMLANSKMLHDKLASTLITVLQNTMANCFRDVLINTVVPNFEKTCKTLFMQLNEAFAQGTREQLMAMEAQCERQRLRQVERVKDTSAQINALSESVRIGNDATANMVRTELHAAIAKAVTGLQEAVARSSREAVSEAITKTMKETAALRASRAATPQPADPQALMSSVLALVSQGQLNTAFQQALCASDLSVVVSLCERVNPQQIFSQTPCPLQQPVLLSLIQQLSADLTNHTELKHKFLEEAVMNLDKENAITREHMPGVLVSLQKQLTAYIQSTPNNRVSRSMRVLLMATQALVPT